MLFNSYVFIFAFLPIAVAGFAILGQFRWRRAGIIWLILCSAFYYGYWNWHYLFLLGILLIVNYLIGTQWLCRGGAGLRKAGLIVGLTMNLSALAYFKYAGLLVKSFDALTGTSIAIPAIVLPLGISFFVFQKIAYLVDMYKGRGYSRNFLDYCLFVAFFPQLIAGPIVHPREILPQLSRRMTFGVTAKNLSIGLTLFVFGLTKKAIIADNISPLASELFAAAAAGRAPALAASWLGVLAYTLQIYFDFSGYTDMAIGLARIFSVRLPLNFNSPYQARNMIDFWRRWHMTLSRFLRDYLYFPLGGNRKGPIRRYANLMITMLLGGLWHGANWTFMAWGGLHGLFLIVNHVWTGSGRAKSCGTSVLARVFAHGLTFLCVIVAWVFFRAENFHSAGRILAGMSGAHGIDCAHIWHARTNWILVMGLLAFVFFAPNSQRIMALARPALGVLPPTAEAQEGRLLWRPDLAWAVVVAVAGIASVLLLSTASEFIYYQF
jgi:D-alanyl-lipoteichoic acid acyltransferase DltB (MBOAT superfamily)